MEIHIPSRKICEEFHLTYELKGAQKAIDFLSDYYEIRRMKIALNGRKVGNGYDASYSRNIAHFKKRGLNKANVLHEFFHHIAYLQGLEMTEPREEREANRFTREIRRR